MNFPSHNSFCDFISLPLFTLPLFCSFLLRYSKCVCRISMWYENMHVIQYSKYRKAELNANVCVCWKYIMFIEKNVKITCSSSSFVSFSLSLFFFFFSVVVVVFVLLLLLFSSHKSNDRWLLLLLVVLWNACQCQCSLQRSLI